jgi:hypothetical protein
MEEGIRVWYRGLRRDESDPRTDEHFSVETVAAYCKRARTTAAMGPDHFSPHFLVQGSQSFYEAFTAVINYSYDHGVLPSDWRCANVCALFKGGNADATSPDSFRPISHQRCVQGG